jgi:UDP-glucose-4-epimerase GalE
MASEPVILVSGGAGYIGAHTCKELKRNNFYPVVLDNLSTGHRSFVKWGPLVECDIRDSATVEKAIRDTEAQAVLHFAGHSYVGESVQNPFKYYDNNITGTLSLLSAMVRTGCKHIVFSSTCAIYGEPATIPILEDTPPKPINPYGASKHMVERILADFKTAYGLESTCLRYFNACGADLDGELGEDRTPETHLIPRAMLSILGRIQNFELFGSDYPTPDGTAIRDYIHVTDIARVHVQAVQHLLDGNEGVSVNLGTGLGYSVREIMNAIAKETGVHPSAIRSPRRQGDPPILIADIARARQILGYDPQHSDLSTIVRSAWAWHKATHSRTPSCSHTNA